MGPVPPGQRDHAAGGYPPGQIPVQRLAPAVHIHEIQAERGLVPAAIPALPPARRVAHQEMAVVNGVGIHEEVTLLAVVVDALGGRRANRRDQLGPLVLLPAAAGVEDP